jgi:hypothetical protein
MESNSFSVRAVNLDSLIRTIWPWFSESLQKHIMLDNMVMYRSFFSGLKLSRAADDAEETHYAEEALKAAALVVRGLSFAECKKRYETAEEWIDAYFGMTEPCLNPVMLHGVHQHLQD